MLLFASLSFSSINSYSNNELESSDHEWGVESRYDEYFKTHIICRKDWHAETARNDMERDLIKCKFAIHHSAGSAVSSGETVKNIQHAHIHEKKWSDIGYHFLIGRDGKGFEGRELQWQGAHVEGENKANIGICFLGCFESTEPRSDEPTPEMIGKAGELVGILAHRFNIELSFATLKGHKQHKNAKTFCPGNKVMECLDDILSKAQSCKKERG